MKSIGHDIRLVAGVLVMSGKKHGGDCVEDLRLPLLCFVDPEI